MNEPATSTTARRGFFPLVHGDEVDLSQSGAAAVLARGAVSVQASGANLLVAGGDLHIEQGGGQTLLAAGDVTIRQGGTIVAAANSVKVDRGWVGVALGGRVDLDDSRVLLGPVEALALGVGLGMVAACAKWCVRRCSRG